MLESGTHAEGAKVWLESIVRVVREVVKVVSGIVMEVVRGVVSVVVIEVVIVVRRYRLGKLRALLGNQLKN